jgi:hypothetical protein
MHRLVIYLDYLPKFGITKDYYLLFKIAPNPLKGAITFYHFEVNLKTGTRQSPLQGIRGFGIKKDISIFIQYLNY